MIVGIDLGTTNSAVAVFLDGVPTLIPNRAGQLLTPSAVSVAEDGTILVGMAARDRQVTHPEATATAFKRYMGTSRTTQLAGLSLSAEDLSAFVLRSLKEDAEHFLGGPVTEAVITVPAYFNDRQRRATKRAGELAGLKVSRLINEPTAAALAYGLHSSGDETSFLVFDLGGGTFDVSIVEMFEGVIEVRSSTGDNRLGGEDFNAALATLITARLTLDLREAHAVDERLQEIVREQAERVRRALSSSDATEARIVWDGLEHVVSITEGDLEEAAASLLTRLRDPVVRALRDGNVDKDGLSEIILIGGTTRMPLVRRMVTLMFGRFPNSSVNPDEAVALGAAIQAGLKIRDQALREVVLTDVAPFSLGIEHARRMGSSRDNVELGLFAPIIDRNTIIPASRVKSFTSMYDRQTMVEINVYQGEARKVADNVSIGKLQVPLRSAKEGKRFDVRFTYDVNGMLDVDVTVPEDGTSFNLVIADEDEKAAVDMDARRLELEALKQHPRDAESNRALIARLERVWETRIGDVRDLVGLRMAEFVDTLNGQDPREVERSRRVVSEWLDGLEGEALL